MKIKFWCLSVFLLCSGLIGGPLSAQGIASAARATQPTNTNLTLCLDVGNTDILGGLYEGNNLKFKFRYNTAEFGSEDQFGIFLLDMLKYQQIEPSAITGISMGSVVPTCNRIVKQACTQYLPEARYYELDSVQCNACPLSPIRIKYKNAQEVGADLISNAIGATGAFPSRNLIIVDMGTATTLCAVTKNKEFLGGAIIPGANLWAKTLHVSTAQLPQVQVGADTTLKPIGTSDTLECIHAGIYFGQLGAIKEIIARTKAEFFKNDSVVIIGTGGCSYMYQSEKLFDYVMPELVLQGLLRAYETLGQLNISKD